MSESIWIALITLAGTVVTVLASASSERAKNRKALEKQLADFKKASDESDKALTAEIGKVASALDAHIKAEEVNDIKARRVRIIRAADEVAGGRPLSKEYVEDILEDIDTYEAFCDAHPDYHNHKGKAAMSVIKEYYTMLIGGKKQ